MSKSKIFFMHFGKMLRVTLILMLICGLIFPLLLTGLSAVIFPKQAKGSLIVENGVAIGSEFVGQDFTEPYFMKGRPSAVHYNTYTVDENGSEVYLDGSEFSGLASGSQNLAPSNPQLKERVEADIEAFLAANPTVKREELPADIVTASGSGLDPHISPEAARLQVPAIAEASGLSEEALYEIIENNTDKKVLGVFGEDKVNVLLVNLDIAKAMEII